MSIQHADLGVLAKIHLKERTETPELKIPDELQPVLSDSAFAFEQDLQNLQTKIQNRKSAQKFECEYPLIDCSFLAMKGKKGWPRFAVYGLFHSTCSLGVCLRFNSGQDELVKLEHHLPDVLARHYQPFFVRLADLAYRASIPFHSIQSLTMTIEARFRGVIPMEQRQFLRSAAIQKFDSVYLIAEAPEWKIQQEVVHMPVSDDPLIIGVKGDETFLLGKFDVTTVEEYVAKEFTS